MHPEVEGPVLHGRQGPERLLGDLPRVLLDPYHLAPLARSGHRELPASSLELGPGLLLEGDGGAHHDVGPEPLGEVERGELGPVLAQQVTPGPHLLRQLGHAGLAHHQAARVVRQRAGGGGAIRPGGLPPHSSHKFDSTEAQNVL